jgi:hypothetical protein
LKKITLIFLISFCSAQNLYLGSTHFDYSGTESGSFQGELTDSTFGGAIGLTTVDENGTSIIIFAFEPLDLETFSILFVYLQSPDSALTSATWTLPPSDFDNPDALIGFIPEADSSFFDLFTSLIPDSSGADSLSFDSTSFDEILTDLLVTISTDAYIGLSGEIQLNNISSDSITGILNSNNYMLGFPPPQIDISDAIIQLAGITIPFVGIESETLFPDKMTLYPSFPNPFNPTTTIRFFVETMDATSLRIYDINGRFVKTLLNGEIISGENKVVWNASTQPSGVYFIQLVSGNKVQTQKLILMK